MLRPAYDAVSDAANEYWTCIFVLMRENVLRPAYAAVSDSANEYVSFYLVEGECVEASLRCCV